MVKREENVIFSTVLLVMIVIVVVGLIVWWTLIYVGKTTEGVEEGIKTNSFGGSMIKINNVERDDFNALMISIENRGQMPIIGLEFTVIIPEGATNDKGEEVPSGEYSRTLNYIIPDEKEAIRINFFEVKEIPLLFEEPGILRTDGALKDYEKIEVIPILEMEDGTIKQENDDKEIWVKK